MWLFKLKFRAFLYDARILLYHLFFFLVIKEYLALFNTYLDTTDILSVLMSTKHDLSVIIKSVDIEELMHFYTIQKYFPTSAITGLNIDTIFHYIGQLIANKRI